MGRYLGMKYNLSPEVHRILDQGDARIATVKEQADWVVGHFNRHDGNQSYRFRMKGSAEDVAYVITKDIDLPPLYGPEALTLIVPRGVTVRHRALGDNRLYHMDHFEIENDPGHEIMVSPALASELLKKRNLTTEDFVYAEAASVRTSSTERTLGLVSEGSHAPGIFQVLWPAKE
ncbi:MAG: hypothetical protein ACAH83_00910 [Alphaproteobacteria bacterium]